MMEIIIEYLLRLVFVGFVFTCFVPLYFGIVWLKELFSMDNLDTISSYNSVFDAVADDDDLNISDPNAPSVVLDAAISDSFIQKQFELESWMNRHSER